LVVVFKPHASARHFAILHWFQADAGEMKSLPNFSASGLGLKLGNNAHRSCRPR
jgi:hypothetical protein